MLEKILNSKDNPKLREKAVFILSQKSGEKVIPLLTSVAKTDSDKGFREKAMNLIKESKLKSNNKSQRGYNDD